MSLPTEERVSQLVAGLVEGRGFDLEGVSIAGGRSGQAKVTIVVDRDAATDLDTVAELSADLSEVLDTAGDFGEAAYLLEVTTPGVERPLDAERHWRRARGRKARITLRTGAPHPEPGAGSRFEARIGALTGDSIALVLGGRRNPHRVTVPLADIAEAVVQVEFNAPGAAELELAGGVVPGRPDPRTESATPLPGDDSSSDSAIEPQSGSATEPQTEGIVE
ncbi:ribosome maturation factor RimP [Nocardia jiangsuensis]|uniref:Ribosome maturation factor RimP n=1 Tax=Nocardia jiangsuensis TaxID=1691563 RepID=A0ABV8DPQ7_9NOCA